MSEQKQTEVVEMPGINFAQQIRGADGRPLMEAYVEDEDQDRAEWLETKRQLVGRLSEDEAEELLSLRKKRPRTLGSFCAEALYYRSKDEKTDYVSALRRGSLARKLTGDDDSAPPTLDLSKRQRKMILDAGASIWVPLVMTEVFLALEGEAALQDEIKQDK